MYRIIIISGLFFLLGLSCSSTYKKMPVEDSDLFVTADEDAEVIGDDADKFIAVESDAASQDDDNDSMTEQEYDAKSDNDSVHDSERPDSGGVVWVRQLTSSGGSSVSALVSGGSGGLFAAGETFGDMDGQIAPNTICGAYGGYPVHCGDIFLSMWTTDGHREWTKLSGEYFSEIVSSLVYVDDNTIYTANKQCGQGGIDSEACLYDYWNSSVYLGSISKWNASGEQIWEKSAGELTSAYTLAQASDNGLLLMTEMSKQDGADTQTYHYSLQLSKWSADGDAEWDKTIDTSDKTWKRHLLASDAAGNINVIFLKWAPDKLGYHEDDPELQTDAEMPDIDTTGDVFTEGAMTDVPAGPFLMGCGPGVNPDCDGGEHPFHIVDLPSYRIGKYEVTVGEYQKCIDAGICKNSGGAALRHFDTFTTDQLCNIGSYGKEEYPANCITWYGALAYCNWQGLRLPTEAEWEKAARGLDDRSYPWGDTLANCKLAKMNSVYNGCGEGTTTVVGSFKSGVSPYGAYDMAGNVAEWVSDRYSMNYYQDSSKSDPLGPDESDYDDMRVVRGGSYLSDWKGVRALSRSGAIPGNNEIIDHPGAPNSYGYLGFRCARDN